MPPFDYDGYASGEELDLTQRAVISDLKAYQVYLTEPAYFEAALSYLEAQLAEARTKVDGLKKVLSNELADKEVRCGLFKPGVNIYYKVLADDTFVHVSQQGMQFKDVGAGFIHGEYTHRIQWYVCMYHQTAGFGREGYKVPGSQEPRKHGFRPVELFGKVNLFGRPAIHKRFWPRNQVSGSGFLWDTLFDRNSNHVNENDGITSPEAFNKSLFNPELLLSKLGLGSGVGTRAGTYPTLSEIVTRRYLKRIDKIKPETNEELIAYAIKKHEAVNSKYAFLIDPERNDESREKILDKGALVLRNGGV